jgi:hypothetical protein
VTLNLYSPLENTNLSPAIPEEEDVISISDVICNPPTLTLCLIEKLRSLEQWAAMYRPFERAEGYPPSDPTHHLHEQIIKTIDQIYESYDSNHQTSYCYIPSNSLLDTITDLCYKRLKAGIHHTSINLADY